MCENRKYLLTYNGNIHFFTFFGNMAVEVVATFSLHSHTTPIRDRDSAVSRRSVDLGPGGEVSNRSEQRAGGEGVDGLDVDLTSRLEQPCCL